MPYQMVKRVMKKNKAGMGIRAPGGANKLSSQKRSFWGVLEQKLKRSEEQATRIFRGSASQAKILGWEWGRHVSVLVRRPVWLQRGGKEKDTKVVGPYHTGPWRHHGNWEQSRKLLGRQVGVHLPQLTKNKHPNKPQLTDGHELPRRDGLRLGQSGKVLWRRWEWGWALNDRIWGREGGHTRRHK